MDNLYMESLVEVNDEENSGNAQLLDTLYLNQLMAGSEVVSINDMAMTADEQSYQGTGIRKTKAGLIPEKPHMCLICKIPYTNSSNLKAHLRTHTGEKPFTCEICSAAFVQSSNLKAHKRIHTGERPYCCEVCGQSFSRSSHLKGHMRTHTGEKPYVCGTCGEIFATSTHLRNHSRKHAAVMPFTCSICEMNFKHDSQLQAHIKVHNGDRPYKCCDCGGAFRSKGDLRSHRKLHTLDRPFICGKCGKTFKTYAYLGKHLNKCPSSVVGDQKLEDLVKTDIDNIVTEIKNEPNDYSGFEMHDADGNTYSFQEILPDIKQIQIGDIEEPHQTAF